MCFFVLKKLPLQKINNAMNINNQKNGNSQLNSIRNEFNDRTKKKLFLGNSGRVFWSSNRRFRSI